jgi:pimeloyl-ACP methyl ester carboxylesterase
MPSIAALIPWMLWAVLPAPARAQVDAPATPDVSMARLLRYEPTGLSLLSPYARGKVPVVFVHGLWSNPCSWHRMIAALEDDPGLGGRYQYWTFGYSTGDPILYSASLMREALDDARRKLDPDRSDPALDRMILVGHSMGGLLSRTVASNSGDRIWRAVSDRPFDQLRGEPADRELFRGCLFFEASPAIRRVIYIATPHRGSHIDRGPLERIGSRLVRIPDPLRAAHHRLVSLNEPTFFRDHVRKSVPTSIEELDPGSPILMGLSGLPMTASVASHSIIAVRPGSPPADRTDGLVRYASAHLEGVRSEKVVATGHLCQDHPEVIGEVRRILAGQDAP